MRLAMTQFLLRPALAMERSCGVRSKFIGVLCLLLAGACRASAQTPSPATAPTLPKLTACMSWFAQAEQGGFYQAVATGLYRKAGLDVVIKSGGPQINGQQLLAGGLCDFYTGYPMQTLQAVEQGAPVVSVAAFFQKDPQALIAHQGVASLESLKGQPIMVAQYANATWWPWLEERYGYTKAQERPYNASVAPFLHDNKLSMQGYVGNEPLAIEKGGETPVVFLLADHGWMAYGKTIDTRKDLLQAHPQWVTAFVKATLEGWKSYLANPVPGNKLILQANPKQTAEQLAFGLRMLKQYRIVTGGEAATQGLGTMSAKRWAEMFHYMARNKMIPANFAYTKAFDLSIVDALHILPDAADMH
jgi:NitT/TauT family transport system substrate-binding protein